MHLDKFITADPGYEATPAKQTTSPIFGITPRNGVEEELPHDYDPGYLEEAMENRQIYVHPISGRTDWTKVRCPLYLGNGPDENLMITDTIDLDKSGTASTESPNETLLIACEGNQPEHPSGIAVCEPALADVSVEMSQTLPQPIVYQRNTALVSYTVAAPESVQSNDQTDDAKGPLANFTVIPKVRHRAIDHNGRPVNEKSVIHAELVIHTSTGVIREPMSIPWEKVSNLTSLAIKQNPICILYDKKSAKQLEIQFRKELEFVPQVDAYVEHGWQIIAGEHQYVHKAAPGIPGEIWTDMTLPYDASLSPACCYEVWRRSLQMYSGSGVMATLSLFSFLGVTYRLFEEAGYPPQFVLFLVGKTNSYKTSIGKLLFMQVETDEHRNHPRRLDSDTRVSMERGLVEPGRDNVTLFDDFSPGDGSKRLKLESDLESLIRSVGDGSTKSRSNINLEDRRGEGVKGVVALTGELRGKGLSSNLRCLYVTIQAQLVDTKMLSWFQMDGTRYGTLLQHLIFFLSASWSQIVSFIANTFDQYRKEARRSLNTGRMADDVVVLWIVLDILKSFFTDYCGVNKDQTIYSELRMELLNVVRESERIAYEEDPAITFMRALATMLENGELRLKPDRMHEADLQAYDGFEEGDYVFLLPTQAYSKIRSWIMKGGGRFDCDEKEILSALCHRNYAVSSRNGDGKVTLHARLQIEQGGKKLNFIKIRRSAIDEFAIAEPDYF